MSKKPNVSKLLFATLLFIPVLLFSQSYEKNIKIYGKVVDRKTKTGLENINIKVIGRPLGTSTDSNGNYSIKLFPGEHQIRFSHIGYQMTKKGIKLTQNIDSLQINVELQAIVLLGEEISVTAIPEEPSIAKFEIPKEKLTTIPNPMPDILLAIKTLPGVYSGNDQSKFYNVRGGNLDENLIYINGFEIFQSVLVRKGVSESPSIINPNMVQKISLQTSNFPVHYGDKLSSVLDVFYQQGNPNKISGVVELSSVNSEIVLEGPVSKKITWIAGARKINYGYLFKRLQTKGDYSPDFKDFQFGLNWQPDKKNRINFVGILANSLFKQSPSGWQSDWNPLYPNSAVQNMRLSGSESVEISSKLIGLNWLRLVGDKYQFKIGVSEFSQKEYEDTDILFKVVALTPNPLDPNPNQNNGAKDLEEIVDNDLKLSMQNIFFDSGILLGSQHHFHVGFEVKRNQFKDKLFQVTHEDIVDETNPFKNLASSNKIVSYGYSIYGEHTWNPSQKLLVKSGLRFTRYDFNQENLILPRFHVLYQLNPKTDLRFSVGQFAQPPLYKEFRFLGQQSPSDLLAQRAIQIALGINYQSNNSINYRAEVYYKRLKNLISYEIWDVRILYSGRNDAIGYVYGLDAHLRGNFVPSCLSWISYSYMVAREDLDFDQEKWVPRPSDIRHTFAATIQDKMEFIPGSRFHMRVLFGSGYHYTYRFVRYNEQGDRVITLGKRNAFKIPYYRRFDVGFTQKIKIFNLNITLKQEMLNAFNRYNVLGYSWVNGLKVEHGLSRRTFIIGAKVEF